MPGAPRSTAPIRDFNNADVRNLLNPICESGQSVGTSDGFGGYPGGQHNTFGNMPAIEIKAERLPAPERKRKCQEILAGLDHSSRHGVAAALHASTRRVLTAHEIRLLLTENSVPFGERPNTCTPGDSRDVLCPKQRRRAKKSDRWANSGGQKGSRDLPYDAAHPFIRRRYGSIFCRDRSGDDEKGKRYYEVRWKLLFGSSIVRDAG
jgi:hypothetical protein